MRSASHSLVASLNRIGFVQAQSESMLTQLRQQVRDIQQSPDGLIYLVTRQDANRTPNSGIWFYESNPSIEIDTDSTNRRFHRRAYPT